MLKNPKHERFCHLYVSGETAGNASATYAAVGFKPSRQNANALLHRHDISRRIAELQDQVARIEAEAVAQAIARLAITKEAVLAELAKIGFANMLDYVRTTEDGGIVVDLSRLDRDRAAAIQVVIVDSYFDGRGEVSREVKRVRFKLADKLTALVNLGKHLGMFVERARISSEYADMTDDELRNEIERIDRQLADLGVTGGEKARPAGEGELQ